MGDRPEEVMEMVANTIVSAIFFWGWGYVLAKRFVPVCVCCVSVPRLHYRLLTLCRGAY